jgi:peptidoglycan-associated lipoprotein
MRTKHLAPFLIASIGASFLFFSGCAKKPPVQEPEPPPPPVVETPKPQPVRPPEVDQDALRRQRIQARIAETFKPIYFDYDGSSLTDDGKRIASAIGDLMKEVPEITARIEGHADERGTNEYNLALGERRAKSVQDYLSSYGVKAGRLTIISYGEEKPAMEGSEESAYSKNRRAEFTTTF